MQVQIIETSELGDRSYVVHDGSTAVVVDPQRDIDRVLAMMDEQGLTLAAAAETHIHNDYVTGGLELSQRTGAEYLVNGDDEVAYERTPIRDGEERQYGDLTVRAMATPGHTHTHLSYVVSSPDDDAPVVFTGGSLLFGSVGRTDLLGEEHTDTLTRKQYRTAHALADALPDNTAIYPTHGFGSFCSTGAVSGADESTIGDERQHNQALTIEDEQTFVDELIANLTAYPAYYAHMQPMNEQGPDPVDLSAPTPVDADELRARIDRGEWVVDLRSRTLYASGHLAGSVGFELNEQMSTYLGWLIPWGTPLTLIGGTEDDVSAAQRQLVRIGIDRPAGAAVGSAEDLARDDEEVGSYPVISFDDLAKRLQDGLGDAVVLDVRGDPERAESAIPGSVHVPIHEVPDRMDEIPDTELLVHCGSGLRAAIVSSLLHRAGRQPVLVDDMYDRAGELGLTEPTD